MNATDPGQMRPQNLLREYGRNARRSMSATQRLDASEKIAATVLRSPWFQRSRYIGCYLGTNVEVDTWPIIARAWETKKRVFAPVLEKTFTMRFRELTSESALQSGQLGILEPIEGEFFEPRNLDIVLTPLVAYDDENNRIGMGKGHFDRTFSFLKDRSHHFQPKLIGLAFACQKVEKIAPNPWDIRLFKVVSEI
jgi:5-formyltetrahydrofolate cyclo-ligase